MKGGVEDGILVKDKEGGRESGERGVYLKYFGEIINDADDSLGGFTSW